MICRKCKKKASNVFFDVIIVADMPLKSLELYLWLVDVNKKILHILKILANIRMFGLVKRHHRQTNDNDFSFIAVEYLNSTKSAPLIQSTYM